MLKSWFETLLKEYEDDFDFRFEYLLLNLTEQIAKIMREKNITRTNFAQRLKVSPAAVTKILRGNSNFTLRTLLAIADALERRLEINFVEENIERGELDAFDYARLGNTLTADQCYIIGRGGIISEGKWEEPSQVFPTRAAEDLEDPYETKKRNYLSEGVKAWTLAQQAEIY
ncbi:MAG TPA: XRE family transcriptional regulator [Deltaproteobacteria bacterium]|nr:XRE family transcriptional regulator [Deltaproteobacteria bacterium]